MKAAVCHAFNEPLTIEEVTLTPPGPGRVKVDMKAVAICHSDISFIDGVWGGRLPAIYGHEAAGVVAELGEGVTDFAVGDHVIVTLINACGECVMCGKGHQVNCERGYDLVENSPVTLADGTVVTHGLKCSAFAEAVVVDACQCARVPGDMSMASASLLACGVITGFGAVVNTAKMEPGSDVVVVGCGGVGLNTIQGAALAGARRIIALDIEEEKLEVAKEFGATHGVLANDPRAAAKVRAMTDRRGADYVFLTVGAIGVFNDAPRYLGARGEMVLVGMPASGAMAEYEPVIFSALSQTIKGALMGDTVLQRDIPYLVELYQQGRLKLDELVTNRYPLEQINEAIADVKAGKSRRNVIVF